MFKKYVCSLDINKGSLIITFPPFLSFRYGKIVSTKAILDKTTNKCKGVFPWLMIFSTVALEKWWICKPDLWFQNYLHFIKNQILHVTQFPSCTMSAYCLRWSLVEFWLETQQQLAVSQNPKFDASGINLQNTGWHLAPALKRRVELENSFLLLSLRRLEPLTEAHWTGLKNWKDYILCKLAPLIRIE